MKRISIPDKISDKLMFLNRHICCICTIRHKHVQIHHIDGNNNNNDIENLAVVCNDCHSKVSSNEGLGRGYTINEVKMYKSEWETACQKNLDSIEKSFKQAEVSLSKPQNEFDFFSALNSILYQTYDSCLYLVNVMPYCSEFNEAKEFSKQIHKIKAKLNDYYSSYAFMGNEILDDKLYKFHRAFNDAVRVAIRLQRMVQKGPATNNQALDNEYKEFDKFDKFIYDIIPDLKEEIISEMRKLYSKQNLRNKSK